MKRSNKNLRRAKKEKNDEFYTPYDAVEKELSMYKEQFRGKVIYCNCDDPKTSNFPKYLIDNKEKLGIKKIIVTGYDREGRGQHEEF